MWNVDMSGFFYLAMFGLFCASVAIICAVGGAIYFVANHVQIV